MKPIILTITLLFMTATTSIYDFKINSIDGEEIDFGTYKDHNLLIVNVASKCGFTPQYADLQKLHEDFGNKITILGFPANDFGAQEPGTNQQIAEFCQKNFGVSFIMFEKISVRGSDQHPLYKLLKEKTGHEPTWNFCKYLVKPDGTVRFFTSNVSPLDRKIIDELN